MGVSTSSRCPRVILVASFTNRAIAATALKQLGQPKVAQIGRLVWWGEFSKLLLSLHPYHNRSSHGGFSCKRRENRVSSPCI